MGTGLIGHLGVIAMQVVVEVLKQAQGPVQIQLLKMVALIVVQLMLNQKLNHAT
jgi:hypothetical protein